MLGARLDKLREKYIRKRSISFQSLGSLPRQEAQHAIDQSPVKSLTENFSISKSYIGRQVYLTAELSNGHMGGGGRR